jgi:hypothetical protein
MTWRPRTHGVLALAFLLALPALAQRQRSPFFDDEDAEAPLPADAEDPAEYSFARLVYQGTRGRWGRGSWRTDSPKAERQFVQGVRRLTDIHTRGKERYVRATDDDLFDYPWLYAVEVGNWSFSDEEAARLREYLLRGGFLMVDDFHGTYQWMGFVEGMSQVFPDRQIVDVPDDDPIFHVFYDLDSKIQVPGIQYLRSGSTFERDGVVPRWRGIYDDKGRLMVMINFNMDLGDAWEWADLPEYPENWTALAYRFGINYIVYAMTH